MIGSKRSCQHTRGSFSGSHHDNQRKEMVVWGQELYIKTSCRHHPKKDNDEILLKGKKKKRKYKENKTNGEWTTMLSAPYGIPWESPTQVLTGPCAA